MIKSAVLPRQTYNYWRASFRGGSHYGAVSTCTDTGYRHQGLLTASSLYEDVTARGHSSKAVLNEDLIAKRREGGDDASVSKGDVRSARSDSAKGFTSGSVGFSLPDFTDTAKIYRTKRTSELCRAYLVFTMCSVDALVQRQAKLIKWARKLLGGAIFRRLMKATVYGQFMGGETNEEVIGTAATNSRAGLFPMFAYTAGETHGSASATKDLVSQDNFFQKNYEAIKNGVEIATACKGMSSTVPQMSSKLTFLAPSEVVESLTTFVNFNERIVKELLSTTRDDHKRKEFIQLLTDVAEKGARNTAGSYEPIPTVSSINEDSIPSLLTNVSFNFDLANHENLKDFINEPRPTLTPDMHEALLLLWQRMVNIAQLASDGGVKLLWDAEQTYLQTGIDCLALDTMRRFNRLRPVVYNTYQCYLKRTLGIVRRDLAMAEREGFYVGAKVVRGAYLDEERRLAAEQGVEDPVNPSYEATTAMYHGVANCILDVIQRTGSDPSAHVTFATHNQDTVTYVLEGIAERNMDGDQKAISFAQLLGMRDHISLALGGCGVSAAKLNHYGPVEEGVAYLSRRVQENRSGVPTADVERALLGKELKRRVLRN